MSWKPLFTLSVLGLLACNDKHTPNQPDGEMGESLLGKWSDLSHAPETVDRHCCFFDSTREEPCGPDTLVLNSDSSMRFTSLPDEPSTYWVAKDTLYRFKSGNREDTLKYAFILRHDTLSFAVSPLCDHVSLASRYRKVRP
jgi:hypothetical protein